MNASSSDEIDGSAGAKAWSPLEIAEMKTGRRLGQIRRAKGFSGRKRMRVKDRSACYHVMSRTVNGEFLFGKMEKEAFRRMMWRMAKFAGVEVLTYAVMDNHFHLLLKVPEQAKWLKRFEGDAGEEKLMEHLSLVYSKTFVSQLSREIYQLRANEDEESVQELLGRFKRRFCDLSLFVKELKERFSRWYNKQNGRRGTLWMDRFKSVLVQDGEALQAIAAYIDLNPVRAGIVDDPAMYSWSGYGEAVAGSKRAKRGLCKMLGVPQDSWSRDLKAHAYYRKWLYAKGVAVEKEPIKGSTEGVSKKGISVQKVRAVTAEGTGHLGLQALALRKRVKSFSEGIAVGSEDFVKGVAAKYRDQFERQKAKVPKKARSETVGSWLYVMRG